MIVQPRREIGWTVEAGISVLGSDVGVLAAVGAGRWPSAWLALQGLLPLRVNFRGFSPRLIQDSRRIKQETPWDSHTNRDGEKTSYGLKWQLGVR